MSGSFNGFVGNRPINASYTGSTGSSSYSSGQGSPRASDEKRMSQAMQKCMDRLRFNPALVVLDYYRTDENMQNRMMDLIMAFLHTWAMAYSNGETRPGEIMHRLGEMSVTMLSSLTAEGGGRHCAQAEPEPADSMDDYTSE